MTRGRGGALSAWGWPYLLVVCLLLWAAPPTRHRVAWLAPALSWLAGPLIVASLIAPGSLPGIEAIGWVLLWTAGPPAAMILAWLILRRGGGAVRSPRVDESLLEAPRRWTPEGG